MSSTETPLAAAARLNRSKLPRTFALIRDQRRRGGWRVARVVVLDDFGGAGWAQVQELRDATAHVLDLAKLRRSRRRIAAMLREKLSPATAEKSAVNQLLAGAVAA